MTEAKGPTDMTGYWVLSKTEYLDEFLRALGFPWVVRKAALKFGTSSVDIVTHTGTALKVTSLNPKGSWTRTYDTDRAIQQPNAEGTSCKTTTWWEGAVLRTKMEGSKLGIVESSRYHRGDTLVVKTTVKPPQGAEATCYWWFERMEALQRHLGGGGRSQLLRALSADQKRVEHATKKDNEYLRRVLLDWERWESPADEFIRVTGPAGMPRRGSTARLRTRSGASSPLGMSQNPSTNSLSTMGSPSEGTRSARLGPNSGMDTGADSQGRVLTTDISLVPRGADGKAMKPPIPAPRPSSPGDNITFPVLPALTNSNTATHGRTQSTENTAAIAAAAAGSSVSTSRKGLHYRSPSTESMPSMAASHATPAGSPGSKAPPTGTEALMVLKLHEFLDGRGITAVVPVSTPNDTSEPQLLSMSPEQAEETAAKLRELETDMLLRRQESVNGFTFCGLVISREKDSLPDHLRVWEMTLA